MDVAKLMPRHAAQSSRSRCRLEYPLKDLRLAERFARPIAEYQMLWIRAFDPCQMI